MSQQTELWSLEHTFACMQAGFGPVSSDLEDEVLWVDQLMCSSAMVHCELLYKGFTHAKPT